MSSTETETKLSSTEAGSKIIMPLPSSSVYGQDITSTAEPSPLNLASASELDSSSTAVLPPATPVSAPSPASNPSPKPTPHPANPSSPFTSPLMAAALNLNAALAELSHQLCHVRWAIDPLQTAISALVDPVGVHVDEREREGEEGRRRKEVEETRRMEELRRKAEEDAEKKGGIQQEDIGSEMAGDFTGAWETSEEWGFARTGESESEKRGCDVTGHRIGAWYL